MSFLRRSTKAGGTMGEAVAAAAELFEEATDFQKIRDSVINVKLDNYITYDESGHLSQYLKFNANDIDEDDVNNDNESNNSDNNLQNKILRARYKCGLIVKHRLTQNVIILSLLIYAILLGAATYPTVRNNPQITSIFNAAEITILIIFTIELLMQLVYRGYKQFIKKGNLIFDFVMIMLSWIVTPIPSLWRTLRILQTFRLVGRLNILREVVKALSHGFKMLAAIMFLMLIIFYIFSVLFTSMYKNMHELGQTEIDYFSTLPKTALTLFQIMCLDDWSEIAREVMVTNQYAWIPFMAFIILASFIVLDSAVGVFCTGLDEIKGVYLIQSVIGNATNVNDSNKIDNNIIEREDYDDLFYELEATQGLITNVSALQQKSLSTMNSFLLPKFDIDIYDIKSRQTSNNNININDRQQDRIEMNRGLSFKPFKRCGIYQISWNQFRHLCAIINNNKIYRSFMISLIILNAALLGLNTYKVLRSNEQFVTMFNYIDTSFLAFFTIEIIIKLLSYGIRACFKDSWFVIDFFVTFISWGLQKLQIFRSIKIIRLLTIISRTTSLRDIVTALQSCLPKFCSLFLLLSCIFYIFSVLFTRVYKDMYKLGQTEIDYFGSLPKTAFTLFQMMCLDDWSEIAREVMNTYKFARGPFLVFIILTALLMIPMMISLLCDAVCVIRQQEYHDLLEQNNLDSYGGGCSSSDNIYTQVDELAVLVDDMKKSQKKMNEYILSLSPHVSSLSSSSIDRQQKSRSKNNLCSSINEDSISFITNVDDNINESKSFIWKPNNFLTTLDDSFGKFDEAYYDRSNFDSVPNINDLIGIIVNASYEILNDDINQLSNYHSMLSHDIGIITEETCDTSTTGYNESIDFITDTKYETASLNHDTSSKAFSDSTEIITNDTSTTENNKTDVRSRNKETTTTLDDNDNNNNIEEMCSSSSSYVHDDNGDNNNFDEQYEQKLKNSSTSQSITQYDCVPMQHSKSNDSSHHQVIEEDVPNIDPILNDNTITKRNNVDCYEDQELKNSAASQSITQYDCVPIQHSNSDNSIHHQVINEDDLIIDPILNDNAITKRNNVDCHKDQELKNSAASQSITQCDCVPLQLSNSDNSIHHQVINEDDLIIDHNSNDNTITKRNNGDFYAKDVTSREK